MEVLRIIPPDSPQAVGALPEDRRRRVYDKQ
jgi:hypothetical protein